MPPLTYARKQYLKRIRAGKCGNCGRPEQRTKKDGTKGTVCKYCHAKTLKWNNKHKRKILRFALVNGYCQACIEIAPEPRLAIPGETRCGFCAEANSERLQKLRANRKGRGECPGCGEPPDGEFVWCKDCRERNTTNHRNQKTRREAA